MNLCGLCGLCEIYLSLVAALPRLNSVANFFQATQIHFFGRRIRCSNSRTRKIPTTRPFFNKAWTEEGKARKNPSGMMETIPPKRTGIPMTK
jgi:hypothetical protein